VILALLGCAAAGPGEPLPNAAVATGVAADGPGWSATAAQVRFAAGSAQAAEPTVVKSADGKPPLEITAQRSDWDLRGGTARFSGSVIVRRAEVEMRCAALEVRYAKGDRVDRVVATGDVRVTRDGRSASAERAELVGENGSITLTGNPRLAEGPNTLVGTTIVLWLDDERATCEGTTEGTPCRLVVEGAALR
jgi:lipopolysaccharide export system protein LptA